MRSLFVVLSVWLSTAVVACQFPYPPSVGADASDSIDAADGSTGDGAVGQYSLTITVDGASTGTGIVTVEPGGFTCVSGVCTRMFDAGTTLSISVAGDTGLDGVASISGDCQSSPCSIAELSGDRSIAVRFVRFQCAPGTETCAANAYTQCGADGNFVSHVIPNGAVDGTPATITMQDYVCPMGCHDTQPRCADIALGNGVEVALDAVQVSPEGIDLMIPRSGGPSGVATVNTNSFDSGLGTIQVTNTDGTQVVVPAQRVDQPGPAPTVLVLKTRTFTLRQGSTLRAEGPVALVIASNFDVYIAGTLDLSGTAPNGVPTGGAGAVNQGTNTCIGGPVATTMGATGGGGGSCSGGVSSTGATGGTALAVSPPLLTGGCGGGRGTGFLELPGAGGGGLSIVSRIKVTLTGTSIIDLSGGGGPAGRGGGGGGHAHLQAPLVTVLPGAVVAGRGGSGGAAGPSGGAPGTEGPTAGTSGAPESSCPGCGTGGAGGAEVDCRGRSGTGSGTALGAGGGAAGSCRIYTRTGNTSVPAGTMKLPFNQGTLTPRSP